jgi:hypothetical protein
MVSQRASRIVAIIQEVAAEFDVFRSRGQGAGNVHTNSALAEINSRVERELGAEVLQCVLCPGNRQSVDFFLRDEATVIELEFSLSNPYPCLEKDLFKVLLAKEAGVEVKELVLVGDPGSIRRLSAPAPKAVIDFVRKRHGLTVSVVELKAPAVTPQA